MESNKEYQKRELESFLNQKSKFFDTIAAFSADLEDMDVYEQITWIENGSYGAGACFALQHTLNRITPRCNAIARIGQIILRAFYGMPFTQWNKLSTKAQTVTTKAVKKWMKKKHNFAQTLEI